MFIFQISTRNDKSIRFYKQKNGATHEFQNYVNMVNKLLNNNTHSCYTACIR